MSIALHIERLDLSAGNYHVNVGLYHPSWSHAYEYHWDVYPLTIEADVRTSGTVSPPRSWTYRDQQSLRPQAASNRMKS